MKSTIRAVHAVIEEQIVIDVVKLPVQEFMIAVEGARGSPPYISILSKIHRDRE